MQLVMAMQADGKHPLGPGPAGDTTSRPASPEPLSPLAVQHPSPWQHIFHILQYLLSLCLCRQPWVPSMLGADGCPSPAPERGGERRDPSPCSAGCPMGVSEPILGGCWGTAWIQGSTEAPTGTFKLAGISPAFLGQQPFHLPARSCM